jgi:hypothetical protein
MKNKTLPITLLASLLLLFGCSALGTKKAGGSQDAKNTKGIAASQICSLLANPRFETRFDYDGASCSGSTYFGVRDSRTASYETDLRPAFSYAAIGDQGTITRISLAMTKREDGAEFFLAEANSVALLIHDQPLAKEMEDAITGSLPATGGDFTTTSQVGNARAELVRSNTDKRFHLEFRF